MSVKIGVIACRIMQRELDKILSRTEGIEEVIYLEAAQHIYPDKLKVAIKEKIDLIKDDVDVVFLGYGYCQSLEGIEKEFDIPVILPQAEDCIAILLTPERYAEELLKEAGTWFMTPGWAELGIDMIIKELHLERFTEYGEDPIEWAKELFAHYKRGLFIDTGVGDNDYFMSKAKESCDVFDIELEKTVSTSTILEQYLEKCRSIEPSKNKKALSPSK